MNKMATSQPAISEEPQTASKDNKKVESNLNPMSSSNTASRKAEVIT